MEKIKEYIRSHEALNRFVVEHSDQLKKITVVSVLIVVALFVFAFSGGSGDAVFTADGADAEAASVAGDSGSSETEGETGAVSSVSDGSGNIFVDIGGAVRKPMLAELPQGSRVEDAIKAAGGLTEEADLTNINRAEFLSDGDKVYIPEYVIDEDGNIVADASGYSLGTSGTAGSESNSKVNINTADSAQLQTLNGVGPSTAQKIIDYRTSNGKFSSVEDIKNVSGIGDKTFEKLKDHITT